MKTLFITLMVAAVLISALAPGIAQAGPAQRRNGPPVDYQLMAFKNSGMWYFLCEAPLVEVGCPPPPLTRFPPRPPCGPMPLMGQPVPYKVK